MTVRLQTQTLTLAPERPTLSPQRATLTVFALGIAMVFVLRFTGRRWWCECGSAALFTADAWSAHTSQHVFDPYTASHLLHGVILFFVFNIGGLRRFPTWQLFGVMFLEAAWEVFENSPMVIERYRTATAAVGYTGDSVLNSVGDFVSCLGGWFLSRRIGWIGALITFLVLEIGCLLWIRDNLTLNVVMIIHPIEAIAKWQSGG
jgi:hypothetical protein